jgi:2-methylisocitrate lyase-like PEP mutase family enzyme
VNATQAVKARELLDLHADPKLLVLPNAWDPLSARIVAGLGFPAVATASAAIAFSLGFDDGEQMPFETMLEVIGRVARAVDVPVTADVERGYAVDREELADNVERIIEAGAVGINLEDSLVEGGDLRSVDEQCERLCAVRERADALGIHLVVNARTDVYLRGGGYTTTAQMNEVVTRSKAYLQAGADCIYPIPRGDVATLHEILDRTGAPLNAFASAQAATPRELEAIGVARLSVGPGLLRAGATAVERAARQLRDEGSYEAFTTDALSSDDLRRYLA